MNLPEHNPEQPPSLKIIVLDDDRLSSHNHSIQLKFVGETPLITTSDNWQHMFSLLEERGELENVLALALGSIKGDLRGESVVNLLLQLHVNYPRLPILLFNDLDVRAVQRLPESLKSVLMPLGEGILNYQNLLSALKTARQLTGHVRNELPSRIISPSGAALFRSLSGESAAIQKVRQLVRQVAQRPVTVLVCGEPGSGKEVVARNLHYHAGRMGKPFLVLNCAAVAPERFGVELFGIEKDQQGASQNIPGILEKADGGSVFIDEISDLPLSAQALLLRFLEDRTFTRVGSYESMSADVRVVVATRHNLLDKVAQAQFREDLYYRINVMPIEVPPLRERPEDIPDLIKEVISSLENKGYSSVRFNAHALQSLQHHKWPGNVRELANLVERLGIMMPDEVVGFNNLPRIYQHEPPRLPAPQEVAASEQAAVPMPTTTETVPTAETATEPASGQAAPMPFAAEEEFAAAAVQQDAAMELPGVDENAALQQENMAWETSAVDAVDEYAAAAEDALAETAEPVLAPAEPIVAMVPMNESRLRQYLENLEKNLLEVAYADSAGFLEFASDRLRLDMETLRDKLLRYGIISA